MEVIEKQVEKIKEVPYGYVEGTHPYSYNRYGAPFASRGVAGAGLGLGIAGTALGLLALSKGNFNLFGGSGSMPQNVNINTDSTSYSSLGHANGITAPSAFQVWEKECDDTLALQKGLYDWALTQQAQRFADRTTLNSELFGLYKSQIDANFGLYKSTRDGFDLLTANHTRDSFNLYKSQRDADDDIRKELSDLKTQVAINTAIRPYQDKLIQCEIDKAFTAGINYTDKKTCNVIYGQVCLPSTPTITGYVGANQCGCPRIVASTPAS